VHAEVQLQVLMLSILILTLMDSMKTWWTEKN